MSDGLEGFLDAWAVESSINCRESEDTSDEDREWNFIECAHEIHGGIDRKESASANFDERFRVRSYNRGKSKR